MGWPAVSLTKGATRRRGLAGRLGDRCAAALFGLILLVPFLLLALVRRATGKSVTERVLLRGSGGRPLIVRRIRGIRTAGFWATALAWYPALGALAAGKLSLVGIYPFAETDWESLDPPYRERPPEALVGIFGPWIGAGAEASVLARWNQAYVDRWSPAEDFRILLRAFLGIRRKSGGLR